MRWYEILLLVIAGAVIVPFLAYIWGVMLGKGFVATVSKYLDKLKSNKK
jgi:hypothetical protein